MNQTKTSSSPTTCVATIFARANNDLFPIVDGYEVGFVQWTSLKHRYLIPIS